MRMDNARHEEQRKRMAELKEQGKCFFCDQNYLKIGAAEAILGMNYWYVRNNDYPYSGTTHHCIIAPYRHVKRVTELSTEEWQELLLAFKLVEDSLNVPGESIFARSGDMAYTGATLDHLHFHLLVGGPKPEDWKSVQDDNILVTLGHKVRS